jgi:transposase-like protein
MGMQIAHDGTIRALPNSRYSVESATESKSYIVSWNGSNWVCECPTGTEGKVCQHKHAVSFTKNMAKLNSANDLVICPRCDSPPSLLVRRGLRANKYGVAQTLSCKACGYRFVHRPGFTKMRSNPTAIVASLDLYFKGLSLSKISAHLKEFYNVDVTAVTVYNWIRKYVALIKEYTESLDLSVSSKWHADETQVKVRGRQAYLWNMMDSDTRFLIAKVLSFNRRSEEAQLLIEQALNRVGKEPQVLITDRLKSYDAALDKERAIGVVNSTNHVSGGLKEGRNNRLERMHGTLKERTKTMRGLDNIESAKSFTDGMGIYYNYVRPHLALDGKTPAVAAGIVAPNGNPWLGLIEKASFQEQKTALTGKATKLLI